MLTAEPMRTPCLLRNLDQADCKRHGVNKAIQEGHSTAWLRGKRTFDNRPKALHYPLVWVKSQYLHQRLALACGHFWILGASYFPRRTGADDRR